MLLRIFYLFPFISLLLLCSSSPDIPVSELEPYWSSWKEYDLEGESGMYCKKQGDMVVRGLLKGTMNMVHFDSNGMQVPPTKPGSKLFFETDDCEFLWINGIRIEAQERLVFTIAEEGLYYSSGKGKITFKDDHSINF